MGKLFWHIGFLLAAMLYPVWVIIAIRYKDRPQPPLWLMWSFPALFPPAIFFVLGINASTRTGYAHLGDVLGETFWFVLWTVVAWGSLAGLVWLLFHRLPDSPPDETPDSEEG